ncbi:MAG: hypothetical protein RMI89_07645 [Gloeomargarita sp. SKYBB_i_bin120]|nr:hypothetical protein [Gloeomargarita sp. SKYG98]MCS7292832.1 hypothetical protein [Gloeomargarita sp. SKYB120]MDW8178395.1 hypothetical protein [Gloeomargarita sp. SKYBB_i_bin120]
MAARFIATNVLALGYNAWAGFLHHGRGAVICTLNHAQNGDYPTYFLPRFRLAPFLRAWLATPATPLLSHHFFVTHILDVVDHYDPSTEVVFFLESGAQATFFYLKNLPVPPPQSYRHICRQGEEFHLTRCRLPQSD